MDKINYQIKCEELLKDNIGKKLLLHSCCAPCSSYVITYLAEYLNITVIYYNPNIEPLEEYLKRKEEQIKFINEVKTKYKVNFLNCDYDNDSFKKLAKGLENEKERGIRCHKCYLNRLEYTASVAKEKKYDLFTTTLSLSPYKDSIVLNNIGRLLEKKYGVKYLYSDFKKKNGYKRSIELSKEYNLYRQNYCGCVYSKGEK